MPVTVHPPGEITTGMIPPAVLAAAGFPGIDNIFSVGKGGTKEFDTLVTAEAAADAAASTSQPSLVVVGPGEYPEDLAISDDVHFWSPDADATRITGSGTVGTDIVTVSCCGSIDGFQILPKTVVNNITKTNKVIMAIPKRKKS